MHGAGLCGLHLCSRCGDSYQDDFTDALGHTWNTDTVTKAPTTNAAGVRTSTCTVCGETYTEAIPALGSSSDSTDGVGTGSSTPATSDDTPIFAGYEDTATVDGTEVDIQVFEITMSSAQTNALDDLQLEAGDIALVLEVDA